MIISDKLCNKILGFKNFVLYNIFKIKKGFFKISCEKFKLDTHHDFKNMTMVELENHYRKNQAWGDYHPGDLQQWYDPEAIEINQNGLFCKVTNNTKTVTTYIVNPGEQPKDNLTPVTIPFGIGLIASRNSYGYGLYEWSIKMPGGAILWPATWLSAEDSWPPEIDPMEGLSNEYGRYEERIETNIHLGDSKIKPGLHYDLKAGKHGKIVDQDKTLNIKCIYSEKFIKIYYNDFLVRWIRNPNDMKWFKNKKMINIIGTGIRKDELFLGKGNFETMSKNPMEAYYFKFYKENT
jgi:hypothetical protein